MTREQAIEIIKNLPIYRMEQEYDKHSDLMQALEMAIEALGSDTNVGSKWIPCNIDLPKKKDKKSKYGRGEYNGTVVNEKGHVFTTSVIFDYVNKKWVEEVVGWKVIAWCELPEPYKGE